MKILEKSTWEDYKIKKKYKPLSGQINAEIAIIGGGLAGVLTAYQLAKAGKDVALLESKEIGSGVTAYTTGFLTNVIDTDLTDLIKMYGAKNAKLIWESHYQAINEIETIAKSERIDCEFKRCPNYSYALDENELKGLETEHKSAMKIGWDCRMVGPMHLEFHQKGAWLINKQGKYHATKFLYGVCNALERSGVKIYEQSEVKKVKNKDGKFSVETANGKVIAEKVIVATYKPFNNPKETLFKKGMYVSYVFEVQIPKDWLKEAIYEDQYNPYNYFRVDAGQKFDRMIIGGQDHRAEIKMDPEKNYSALEEYLKQFMGNKKYKIVKRWSSKVLEPSDGLALIGDVNPNEYVATAFSGNGMTYSAIASMLLRDLILGKKNPWAKIYDPKRIPSIYQLAKKGKDYTGELFGGAAKNIFRKPKKRN